MFRRRVHLTGCSEEHEYLQTGHCKCRKYREIKLLRVQGAKIKFRLFYHNMSGMLFIL
uniref:Uncharacterized protein n=1 Tax=Anguilla anguilla TaxID=7936 RepID=A0A0E9WX18_ANGAN